MYAWKLVLLNRVIKLQTVSYRVTNLKVNTFFLKLDEVLNAWLASLHQSLHLMPHHFNVLGSRVFCAPLDRYIDQHIDWHSTDVSINKSSDTRPICWSTYCPTLNQYNDRDVSVNISTDTSTGILAEWWSMYQRTIGRYLGRYSGWHSADPLTADCWQNISRLSYNISKKLRLSVSNV